MNGMGEFDRYLSYMKHFENGFLFVKEVLKYIEIREKEKNDCSIYQKRSTIV